MKTVNGPALALLLLLSELEGHPIIVACQLLSPGFLQPEHGLRLGAAVGGAAVGDKHECPKIRPKFTS